jgi:hypothetical protein
LFIYESLRVKVLKTLLTLVCAGFFYYVIQVNELIENFHKSWQFQAVWLVGMAVILFTWLECKLVFDEMLQVVTIRRGFTRVLPATKIFYADIDRIILKRYAYEDEDGEVTNQGYFHLLLINRKDYLMVIFNDLDAIDDALDQLKKHTRIKISGY